MAAAAQAFDTGAYPTMESHCVTNAAGGDEWHQLSTVAGATGASPYVHEGLEQFYCSIVMEELHISKASLVLVLMKSIGLNPQP